MGEDLEFNSLILSPAFSKEGDEVVIDNAILEEEK
jgi:hypothetical protein